jgi:hypothetical protein
MIYIWNDKLIGLQVCNTIKSTLAVKIRKKKDEYKYVMSKVCPVVTHWHIANLVLTCVDSMFIPFLMCSSPMFHVFNARMHANVEETASLPSEHGSRWPSPQEPSLCWFCSIHSTNRGKCGAWVAPFAGTIATQAVSYDDGSCLGTRSFCRTVFSSSHVFY